MFWRYTCFKVCYLPWHLPGNQHRGRLKTKLYEKRDVFTFPKIDFTFISSIRLWGDISHRYSRVCFKNWFSEQNSTADATLLKHGLGLSHRYKNYTVIITSWLTVTKYTFLKWRSIIFSMSNTSGVFCVELFVLCVFVLSLISNVVCVSGSSILD